MKIHASIPFLAAALLLLGAGCARTPIAVDAPSALPDASPVASPAPVPLDPTPAPSVPARTPAFTAPIDHPLDRVTKKTFGLKVSPKDSPVSPEKFSGYHTGVDFETTPEEQKTDVPIRAACDGTLALKKFATGYGGVAVQRCKLEGADVTVVYGHLRLLSVAAKVGAALKAGETLGVLGTGYGKETDGERKHLHFGVHRGAAIDIKGYVQNKNDLGGWIDASTLL